MQKPIGGRGYKKHSQPTYTPIMYKSIAKIGTEHVKKRGPNFSIGKADP
jgi:hypothetical protein